MIFNKVSKDSIAEALNELDKKLAEYDALVKYFGVSPDPAIIQAYNFAKRRLRALLN